MSNERTLMVAAALEGLIAAKACGPVVGGEGADGGIYYAQAAVRIADDTMKEMATKVVPVPPMQPEIDVIVEEEVIINK